MTGIALRPATPADSEFCFQLHKAAMGAYITAIWGWDEQRQRCFHARSFSPGRWQIITADGADIGMLDVDDRPGEIYLSRIELRPQPPRADQSSRCRQHCRQPPARPGGRAASGRSRLYAGVLPPQAG